MKNVKISVRKELLEKTTMMNDHQRRNFLEAAGVIPVEHMYGYGIYSGMSIVDESHVEYTIGSTCD